MSQSLRIYSTSQVLNKPDLQAMIKEKNWGLEFLGDPHTKSNSPQQMAAVLLERAREVEYLVPGVVPITREFFVKAAKLRHVSMFGVGLNHIDIKAATEHGVIVTSTPGANAVSVAELVFALMFSLARRVIPMHNKFMEGSWSPTASLELRGKTLGIAGFGNIGQEVAKIGKALGMNVLFHNRTPRPALAAEIGCTQVNSLEELLPQVDYFSINLPGLSEKMPLIGKKELALMKPSAVLINTGRGSLVDLDALAEAIDANRLGGAGLDVFPREPWTRADMDAMRHPLYSLRNVVCSPHTGGSSQESLRRVCSLCLWNVEQTVNGQRSPNAANPEVYDMANVRMPRGGLGKQRPLKN